MLCTAQPVDLSFDRLAQALRRLDLDFLYGNPELPSSVLPRDEVLHGQVLQHCGHEQRVSLRVSMQQRGKFRPRGEIRRDLPLPQRLQSDLMAELVKQ